MPGTVNYIEEADFVGLNGISDPYAVAVSVLDGAPSAPNAHARYQWNLRALLEGESYSSLFADAPRDVKVAVFDTWPGHQNHPNLVNRYEAGINTVEGGSNTNTAWDGNVSTSSNLHGQGVASIIAAEHGANGMAGVFHRARIIPVRSSIQSLAQSINLAVQAGAEVIHIAGYEATDTQILPNGVSWSLARYYMYPDYLNWTGESGIWVERPAYRTYDDRAIYYPIFKAIREAISAAVDAGVVVTSVAGNWNGLLSTFFTVGLKDTIIAGATNALNEPSAFNCFSYSYSVFAPGGERRAPTSPFGVTLPAGFVTIPQYADVDDVMTCVGPSSYSFISGGSSAGPHIAAAAAIIKSYLPNLSPQQVRRMMERTSRELQPNLSPIAACGGLLSLKKIKQEISAQWP